VAEIVLPLIVALKLISINSGKDRSNLDGT
jgi:hypothetical protein